jgi:hypothetical protein
MKKLLQTHPYGFLICYLRGILITEKGARNLFSAMVTNDDKIKYYSPQSYSGDMTAEDINDSIANRLEDLE